MKILKITKRIWNMQHRKGELFDPQSVDMDRFFSLLRTAVISTKHSNIELGSNPVQELLPNARWTHPQPLPSTNFS